VLAPVLCRQQANDINNAHTWTPHGSIHYSLPGPWFTISATESHCPVTGTNFYSWVHDIGTKFRQQKLFCCRTQDCGMLYLKNSDRTPVSDSLGANWNRTCLSRLLNHGALWQIVFLRLINILSYLLTYMYCYLTVKQPRVKHMTNIASPML